MKKYLVLLVLLFFFSVPIGAMAKIVYTSPAADIWSMDDDGSNQVNLTNNPAADYWGIISHDGKKVLFWSNREDGVHFDLYTMDSAGNNLVKIVNIKSWDPVYRPIWSPDDTKIMFADDQSDGGVDSHLYLVNSDGTDLKAIFYRGPSEWNTPLDWSPDGTKALILLGDHGNAYSAEIFEIELATGNLIRLTMDGIWEQYSAYSPSGQLIAFTAEGNAGSGSLDIYISPANGNLIWPSPFKLTNNGRSAWPAWIGSSDSKIIYTEYDNAGNFVLFMVNADGTGKTALASNGYGATWAPTIPIFKAPQIQVSPSTYNFGNVEFGVPRTMILTISNTGGQDLIINEVALEYIISGDPFTFRLPSSLPVTINPSKSIEVEVAYIPTWYGDVQTNNLIIRSNDPNNSKVNVQFTGNAVFSNTPSDAVLQLQLYIEYAVESGMLWGVGSGNSGQNRLHALQNMIDSAGDLINAGNLVQACGQLGSIYKKVDGPPNPPDFVNGTAKLGVANEIQNIMAAIGCK